MSIIPPGEKIVERKICPISSEEFIVTDKDLEFYDKVSPVFNGKKYNIPSPTLCPDERMRRRLCFRNERSLHKRNCDKTGKQIISMYSPEGPYIIYGHDAWWNDNWEVAQCDVRFDISFFEQFHILNTRTPHIGLTVVHNEGSDYVNYSGYNKNSYLIFAAEYNQNAYYGSQIIKCENCIDGFNVTESQYCYECFDVEKSQRLYWSDTCTNCRDSYFLSDCHGCQDCLFCTNLRNKRLHVFNTPCSEEQYKKTVENFLSEILLAQGLTKTRQQFHTFLVSQIHRSVNHINTEQSIGDRMVNCARCYACFDITKAEDCRYCAVGFDVKDLADVCHTTEGQWGYEAMSYGYHSQMGIVINGMWSSHDCFYCSTIHGSQNCFGCISLKNGSHCILNKPYSVQEYEELAGKIIEHMCSTGEWGEFFPHELSPFGYNETVAQEYFPMSEQEVKSMPRFKEWRNGKPSPFRKGDTPTPVGEGDFTGSDMKNPPTPTYVGAPSFPKEGGYMGWNWYTEPAKTFEGTSITPLPINQYDEKKVGFETAQKNIDALLNGIIVCEITKKPFKVIRQELAFYIENGIPIPTKHPDQRHAERMVLRNPRKLFERTCAECKKDIITTYAPERPEKVVCEECYRKLVY